MVLVGKMSWFWVVQCSSTVPKFGVSRELQTNRLAGDGWAGPIAPPSPPSNAAPDSPKAVPAASNYTPQATAQKCEQERAGVIHASGRKVRLRAPGMLQRCCEGSWKRTTQVCRTTGLVQHVPPLRKGPQTLGRCRVEFVSSHRSARRMRLRS